MPLANMKRYVSGPVLGATSVRER